jgi:hypothetical protein
MAETGLYENTLLHLNEFHIRIIFAVKTGNIEISVEFNFLLTGMSSF